MIILYNLNTSLSFCSDIYYIIYCITMYCVMLYYMVYDILYYIYNAFRFMSLTCIPF